MTVPFRIRAKEEKKFFPNLSAQDVFFSGWGRGEVTRCVYANVIHPPLSVVVESSQPFPCMCLPQTHTRVEIDLVDVKIPLCQFVLMQMRKRERKTEGTKRFSPLRLIMRWADVTMHLDASHECE